MSKKKIGHIVITLLTSALLIAAGCSNAVYNVKDKSDTKNTSPVIMQTAVKETSNSDTKKDNDLFADILNLAEQNTETTEQTQESEIPENSHETSTSNSSVEISKTETSNLDTTTENKTSENSNNSEKTTDKLDDTQITTPAKQETTQKTPEQPKETTPSYSQQNTQSDTQNNTKAPTQSTVQNNAQTTTLKNTEVTSIKLDKTKVTLDVGEKTKLNLTFYPSNVTHKAYTYSTSDNRVAGIDINGVITAKADGTAVITVTTDNGKSAKCTVTVRTPAPTSVSVNPSSLKLSMNDVYTLVAENNTNSDEVNYTWTSSNTNAIKIISFNNRTIAVKAVGCGTSTVTVKTQNNVTASCKITVYDTEDCIKEIVKIVNDERTKNGLPTLVNRIDLNELADIRAKEIVQKFAHTRPDGSSCFSVLSNTHYMSAGENIAYGQPTAAKVMNSWMNSSGHRANILSTDFNCIGVGHYELNGIDYWVQIFIGD